MRFAVGLSLTVVAPCILEFARAAEPSLVMIQSAPGRFEIAAVDPSVAHAIAAEAENAWRLLSGPLALPASFPTPVYVRVIPASDGATEDRANFHVAGEVGGTVSVRIRADAATQAVVQHALVQGLLMRLAVARHGVHERFSVPWWLEDACVGWWQTRLEAAQLDALKQVSSREIPPPIDVLLQWPRGADESRSFVNASIWLLTFLQAESGPGREWPAFLLRLLAGEEPMAALIASYPARFNTADERELWWETGYHHVRRVRTLPTLEAAESQEQIATLARFILVDPGGDGDVVVPLRTIVNRLDEPVVVAEISRRASELAKLIPSLHPFFRNAGLSLAEALAARKLPPARRELLCVTFEDDWRAATELSASTAAALDRLERGSSSR